MLEKEYEKYASLDAKIKALTIEKDKIKTLIVDELYNSGMQNAVTPVGKFTVYTLKTWTYTEEVEEKTEELKALKAKEESVGIASYEEKPSLRFTAIKL